MNKLKEYFKSYYVLNDVSGLLFWDNATNLPKKSIESRSEQMSILSNFTDRIFRSEDIQEETWSLPLCQAPGRHSTAGFSGFWYPAF